jgi:SAM-dependent methyltransferase
MGRHRDDRSVKTAVIRRLLVRGLWRCARVCDAIGGALGFAAAAALPRDARSAACVRGWDKYARGASSVQAGLHEWEEAFYGRFLRDGDRVLLVGCGAGRDLIPLVKAGREVHGLDPSEEALGICARRLAEQGLNARLRQGLIEESDIDDAYDVVIFSWLSYGYVVGRDTRTAVLRRVARRLRPEGRILLSYMARSPGGRSGLRLARLVSRALRSGWRPERGDLVVLTSVGDPISLFHEHRFSPEEIEIEARAAGLVAMEHDARGPDAVSTLALVTA